MFRLSLFLALSVSLHLLAGSLLLRPDTRATATDRSSAATQSPTVVQVLLEPPVAQTPSKPVALSAPRKPVRPAVARVTAKPAPEPARPVIRASPPKSASQSAVQPAAVASVTPSGSAGAAAQPPVTAPVEVFSRQPAFRLPPQQPRYPAQARRRNQQGVVLLEVRLDAHGKQREISLLRSSGFPSLDQAALEAVAQWRFHPETLNGKGVPSRVQIPIEFALLASR